MADNLTHRHPPGILGAISHTRGHVDRLLQPFRLWDCSNRVSSRDFAQQCCIIKRVSATRPARQRLL